MQTTRMVQAVILMVILAMAASCTASKEYSSKLFAPRVPVAKDSQALALRFLELETIDDVNENWVTTDVIMGRDTLSKTLALDNLVKIFPVTPATVDTTVIKAEAKSIQVVATSKSKPLTVENAPVARNANPGEVRTKRTRE